ncbi:two-component regulator propeller domain-containing protein [Chryseolinea sp. T2]|uniref:sensor histidine kinase n=1 Tax=Chryseolinea sp. T2 TaxID=3129255 RepID=UPI00307722F2
MVRYFLLVLAFFASVSTLFAQKDFFSIRNYTAIDGLPQSQVKGILEDKSGYLWIGTEGGGLARFDGREFKVYTTLDGLFNNQVTELELDSKDNLWILHKRGVSRFDGLKFKTFQATNPDTKKNWFRCMYTLHDTLFVISTTGLTTKIHQDSIHYWEKDIYGTRVFTVHTTNNGQVVVWREDGTFLVRGESDSFMIPTEGKFKKVLRLFDFKGNVIVQTESGEYTIDLHERTLIPTPKNLDEMVLSYDEKADVFWTSNGNSLFRVKLGQSAARDTVLTDVGVLQVLNDSEGNTWFASDGRGLFKYYNQDFLRCSSDKLRGVMAIYRDRDGASWIGTMNKGLWKICKGKISSYLSNETSYRNSITCIKESPWGDLWVGTANGLARYDKAKDSFVWYSREDGLPNWFISGIEFDGKGMWVATGRGLSYFDGKKFKTFSGNEKLAQGAGALRYLGKYNTLFFGTELTIEALHDGEVTTLDIPEIQNTRTLSMQSYQDSLLLVGTGGAGVVMYNPATRRRKMITTREGLASDFVYFVIADEKQYIWIGTEKGINRVKLDRRGDIVENLHFDNDNGLLGVETNQNAYFISPDAKYFGLVDGLYEYNDLDKHDMRSFDIHLTDVKLLYGEYSARAYSDSTYGFYQIPYQPVFPPDRNHLTFQFNRVDKRYSKSVRYKYILENFDKTWSLPSTMDQVTYSNLPPGTYTFRVMSTNNRGSWSDTRIAYTFTIKSPFYQTTAFIVGAFIFVAGLVTLILYLRVKQKVNRLMMMERVRQREQEHLRKEIARDFHDEMGNQLTRIINYVSLLRLNENSNAEVAGVSAHEHGARQTANGAVAGARVANGQDLYTKVEDSAKYLYTGTRDFIWSIDPVNDELSKLFIHIRDFGEKLFEEKNMNFRAFNGVREKIRLPYGFSRQANLIFKEAMTNAFKYSEANNISFSLRRDSGDGFEICLEDDGVGFSPDQLQKSNGLQNIRDRANRINAVLRIHSEKHQGTKIILNFALNKTVKYGIAV